MLNSRMRMVGASSLSSSFDGPVVYPRRIHLHDSQLLSEKFNILNGVLQTRFCGFEFRLPEVQ